jgi:hypothetical protein
MYEKQFPNVTDRNMRPESDPTHRYNCLAWAVHNDLIPIWPDEDMHWPVGWERTESVDLIIRFFESLGFENATDSSLEAGFEKVAIYARHGKPEHVARQKLDGGWTSKLAGLVDVWHSSPEVYECPAQVEYSYGVVVGIMRRRWNGKPPVLPQMHPPPPVIIRL